MTAAIETAGLGKSYGTIRAVIDLDLVVEPGQVFAFLGPNGAGKPHHPDAARPAAAGQRPRCGPRA